MSGCPTCGGFFRTVLRRRRGGRAYMLPARKFARRRSPERPLRVYWPDDRRYPGVPCPDPYHDWMPRRRSSELVTDLEHQEHRPPKNLDRRKERSRRHRDRQGKDRR